MPFPKRAYNLLRMREKKPELQNYNKNQHFR